MVDPLNLEEDLTDDARRARAQLRTLQDRIRNDFTYHRPPAETQDDFLAIREQAKILAMLISRLAPPGREQSTALTRLEECVMHANAGIARQFPCENKP